VTTPPQEAGAGTTLELEDGESVRAVTIWVVKA
jgi:hypothetical protein